jgi:integrase
MRFVLMSSFECAISNDLCVKNPVKSVKPLKKIPPKGEVFTESDMNKILAFAKTDELFGVQFYMMYHTAMRSQELRALTIDNIDLDKRVVTIEKAIKRDDELGPTKNDKTRYVPIEPDVAAYLSENTPQNVRYILGDSDFVPRGGFRSRYEDFFKRLNKWLKSNGEPAIKRKSSHAVRRTRATIWHKNGMPIAVISELLGHSSTDVTDRYIGLSDVSDLSAAVDKYGTAS